MKPTPPFHRNQPMTAYERRYPKIIVWLIDTLLACLLVWGFAALGIYVLVKAGLK